MKLSTLFFGFSLLTLMLVLSCSKDGNGPDNTVTVSGKVTLEGLTDYSGVTVSLYNLVALNPEIAAINQQFPTIGVKISQETEFDHRDQTAVYSTTTNANGDWNINNVTAGNYHIVAKRDNFGWRHVVDVQAGNASNIQLKNEKTLTGTYTNQTLIFDNDFIRINGNTLFDQNSQITFQGRNYLVFNGNQLTLLFQGSVSFQNNSVLFILTANHNSNCRVVIENNNNLLIKNVVVQDDLEIRVRNSNFNIENSIFHNATDIALRVSQGTGNLRNCLAIGSEVGINIDQITYCAVEKNIFYQNQNDVHTDFVDSSLFKNNFFLKSERNLDLITTNSEIINNELTKSQQNITASGVSDIKVKNNNFVGNTNNIRLNAISHNLFVTDLWVNQNNFMETNSYIIFLEAAAPTGDVDAIGNYWGTTNQLTIGEKILDGNDISSGVFVNFIPFLMAKTDSAGIKF